MESDAKSPGLFRPSLTENIHWAVIGLVVLYVILSECAGFYLLGPPSPGQDRVASRCTECMILWGFVYAIIIMSSAALKKPIMTRRAVAWGTLTPVLFGFAVVGWVWWRGGFLLEQAGPPGLLRTYLSLLPAFPAAEGLAIAALVWLEVGVAKRWGGDRPPRP